MLFSLLAGGAQSRPGRPRYFLTIFLDATDPGCDRPADGRPRRPPPEMAPRVTFPLFHDSDQVPRLSTTRFNTGLYGGSRQLDYGKTCTKFNTGPYGGSRQLVYGKSHVKIVVDYLWVVDDNSEVVDNSTFLWDSPVLNFLLAGAPQGCPGRPRQKFSLCRARVMPGCDRVADGRPRCPRPEMAPRVIFALFAKFDQVPRLSTTRPMGNPVQICLWEFV